MKGYKDKYMDVYTLRAMVNPQQAIWLAMHQDYSSEPVYDCKVPFESRAGEIVVERLLKGGKGHWGPIEHVGAIFNCIHVPSSVVYQLRTHRNSSFDVQSFRYTSDHILAVADGELDIEKVFYFRPVGSYFDRQGKSYFYDEETRVIDTEYAQKMVQRCAYLLREKGVSEEHARGLLPFDARRHFVLSGNLRALLHILDIRYKKDVQLECAFLMGILHKRLVKWCPQIMEWYDENRLGKGRLAP